MTFLDIRDLLSRLPDHQLAQAALAFYGEMRRSMLGVLYLPCSHCVEEFAGGPVEEAQDIELAHDAGEFRAMANSEEESSAALDAFNEEMCRFADWSAHAQWLNENAADTATTWESTWGLLNKIARASRYLQ